MSMLTAISSLIWRRLWVSAAFSKTLLYPNNPCLDLCNFDPESFPDFDKAQWKKCPIEVAPETTQTVQLSVESSQGAELDLEPTIAGINIGLKAVLKLQKTLSYSYELVGQNSYLAYSPKNTIGYYWTVTTDIDTLINSMDERSRKAKQTAEFLRTHGPILKRK